MSAGRRNQLITLQNYTTTQDASGGEVQTWADLGSEWAQVFYGRGDERRQAAMQEGEQPATFQLLDNETTRAANIKDRIVLNGDNWNIKGISPETPQRGLIEFTATRSL